MVIVEVGKPVRVLDSRVFCDSGQTTGLPNLVCLTSFYKAYETFLHVTFLVFAPLHMSSISLYQFVNLLRRFSQRVFHPNFLLDEINRVGFASYLAFYAVHPSPGTCPIKERLVLDSDGLRIVC